MTKPSKLLASLALAATVSISGQAQADQMSQQIFAEDRVSGSAMALDALVARPLLVGATIGGAALFVVTAPFSLVGGTTSATWHSLVATPADAAFLRCLGCTPVQDERVRAERRTAQLERENARKAASGN